jgi:hypothetical protein
MIDDPDKAQKLIAEMDAHLPFNARLSQSLKGLIRRQVAPIIPPEQCQVVEVFYMVAYSGACAHPFRQHAPTCSGVFAHL